MKITSSDKTYDIYSVEKINDKRVAKLPCCIKVLLECALRNYDNFTVKKEDIENILNWEITS